MAFDRAAMIDLRPMLGWLLIAGPDAEDFLERVLTCDVRPLGVGQGSAAALLTGKGRFVAAFDLYRSAIDEYTIVVEREVRDSLHAALDRLIILEDLSATIDESRAAFSIQGPQAAGVVGRALALALDTDPRVLIAGSFGERQVVATRYRRSRAGGWDIWCAIEDAEHLREAFDGAGAELVEDPGLVEDERVRAGLARFSVDATSDNLPLESGWDSAVSYRKGCFVGQEVVARIHNLGHPNKRLRRLELEDMGAAIDHGATISNEAGKSLGRVTSATKDPSRSAIVALGYVHYKSAELGMQVFVDVAGDRQPATIAEADILGGSIAQQS